MRLRWRPGDSLYAAVSVDGLSIIAASNLSLLFGLIIRPAPKVDSGL